MGKESKRQQIWAEIRKQREFTLNSLSSGCKIHRDTIETYVTGLRKAGFVELVEKMAINKPYVVTTFTENRYKLAKDVGIDAPRLTRDGKILSADINQDLWRSMKILKEFSATDLIASTTQKTTRNNVDTYCQMLCRAKYLKRNGTRFVFVKNTGAKAPQILRIKAVFDPNLSKVVYQSGGEE